MKHMDIILNYILIKILKGYYTKIKKEFINQTSKIQ